jgi:hypothetical protein
MTTIAQRLIANPRRPAAQRALDHFHAPKKAPLAQHAKPHDTTPLETTQVYDADDYAQFCRNMKHFIDTVNLQTHPDFKLLAALDLFDYVIHQKDFILHHKSSLRDSILLKIDQWFPILKTSTSRYANNLFLLLLRARNLFQY